MAGKTLSKLLCLAICCSCWGAGTVAHAGDCTAADIARAVDQSGAELRGFNVEVQPKLLERMRRYVAAKKLPLDGFEETALDAMQDERLASFDARTGELLLKIDTLGRVNEAAAVPCLQVNEIKASSAALLAVMREKSEYLSAALDRKIAEVTDAGSDVAKEATAKNSAEQKTSGAAQNLSEGKNSARASAAQWAAAAKPDDAYTPPPVTAALPARAAAAASAAESDGYTIEEIRDATRGFFGSVSTGLASVIEHAFQTSGRPTAYVLGSEGGGAFLAGLRYGEGKLFLRHSPETQDVFWHGPSVGTDVGASGSRTMFLIYGLRNRSALFRSFAGVDGSAYLVGGVGVTLLKGGDIVMAPIRSGVGFRVGASVGYVRFTDHVTWNPF